MRCDPECDLLIKGEQSESSNVSVLTNLNQKSDLVLGLKLVREYAVEQFHISHMMLRSVLSTE